MPRRQRSHFKERQPSWEADSLSRSNHHRGPVALNRYMLTIRAAPAVDHTVIHLRLLSFDLHNVKRYGKQALLSNRKFECPSSVLFMLRIKHKRIDTTNLPTTVDNVARPNIDKGAMGARNSKRSGTGITRPLVVPPDGRVTPSSALLPCGKDRLRRTKAWPMAAPPGHHCWHWKIANTAVVHSEDYLAQQHGELTPAGWPVGVAGESTADGLEALAGMTLLIAAHRGYAGRGHAIRGAHGEGPGPRSVSDRALPRVRTADDCPETGSRNRS